MSVNFKSQSGMALFVSLIFLLLLTIVGVVGMQSAILQEKMAGNSKLKNESFQNAEAGLREAEGYLASEANSSAVDSCIACSGNGCAVPDWKNINVTSGTCNVWRVSSSGDGHFYIQPLGVSTAAINMPIGESVSLYRIVAVSTVGTTTTALESVFAKP